MITQKLDVTAVHFRRMKEIHDQWPGPKCVVQFDPQVYREQAQRAAGLCGLEWSDAAFAAAYDASCRHHEAVAIDHTAQAAFEALTGNRAHSPVAEGLPQLLADAAMRESTLQKRRSLWRQERDAAREECHTAWREVASRGEQIVALAEIVAKTAPLEARLAQKTYELDLIRNSRTWRVREALVNVLHGERKTHAGT